MTRRFHLGDIQDFEPRGEGLVNLFNNVDGPCLG